MKKKKYIQKKDKKKLCPVCTNYIFNATIMCYGINSDGNICNYMHKNKKTSEKNRKKINKLNNKIELKKKELNKIEFKKIELNKKERNKKERNQKKLNKSNKNIKIKVNKFIPIIKIKNIDILNLKYNNFITKKILKKDLNFIIETNKIKKKLFNKKWKNNIFDNLKEIENI